MWCRYRGKWTRHWFNFQQVKSLSCRLQLARRVGILNSADALFTWSTNNWWEMVKGAAPFWRNYETCTESLTNSLSDICCIVLYSTRKQRFHVCLKKIYSPPKTLIRLKWLQKKEKRQKEKVSEATAATWIHSLSLWSDWVNVSGLVCIVLPERPHCLSFQTKSSNLIVRPGVRERWWWRLRRLLK